MSRSPKRGGVPSTSAALRGRIKPDSPKAAAARSNGGDPFFDLPSSRSDVMIDGSAFDPDNCSRPMPTYPKSQQILEANRRFIPGGVVSINRSVAPEIVFVRGEGPLIWDADGNEYVDYHAAFAPHFLGHNDPDVTCAVERVLRDGSSLFGTGTTILEGRLAELICSNIGFIDSVQFLNTGSEATYQAIRVARAATGRDHIICTQGGYNGWHNDVSCNVMTPLDRLGPRVSPGEYPYVSLSAGVPADHQKLVHIVNFNDLESVEWVCQQHAIAAFISEPILQNVGVIHPQPGYLEGLRALADK